MATHAPQPNLVGDCSRRWRVSFGDTPMNKLKLLASIAVLCPALPCGVTSGAHAQPLCDMQHHCYETDGGPPRQVYHMDPAHPDRETPPPAPQYRVPRHTKINAPPPIVAPVSMPASTDQFYTDVCHDADTAWTLALNTTSGSAAFLRDAGRVRTGTYVANGDDAYATVGEMKIHLHVASGNASWTTAGGDRGVLSCRFASYMRPERWVDGPPAYTPSPDAPAETPFIIPGTNVTAEAPEPPTYAPPTYAPPATTDHVPITIRDRAAFVEMLVGSTQITAQVDTGASGMTVTESVARELLDSGQAEVGPDGEMTLADGSVHPSTHIVIHRVTVGEHVIFDVLAGVVSDRASMLLGFDVLRGISPRFAINTATSTLDFN
jgi:gag-polyprotein putative aspartyl protease